MDLEMFYVKITCAEKAKDVELLAHIARTLVKLVGANRTDSGYCVVNPRLADHVLYSGGRETCLAFIEGRDQPPPHDLVLCIDTNPLVIVVPEERFGESL
jgi:hypothetical protein